MKNVLFLRTVPLLAASALIAGAACSRTAPATEESEKLCDRLPMATYLFMGYNYLDSGFISRVDFDNYDCFYLINNATDIWNSVDDFSATADSILAIGGSAYPLAKPDVYKYTIEEAHKAGTEAVLTIGNEPRFAVTTPENLAKYAKMLTQAVEYYNFDGIDVDWELDIDIPRHADLMEALRSSLDSLGAAKGRKYTLSTALSIEARYYPEEERERMGRAVDRVNLMAYEVGGGIWNTRAIHNEPLTLLSDSIDRNWRTVPREKLHLGLASYGFRYHNLRPAEHVAEGKTLADYGYYVTYNDVVPFIYNNPRWRAEYDSIDKMYYFIDDAEPGFITHDTPETLQHKFQLAVDKGLGGTFWWEYVKDIVPDPNGGHKWVHTLVPVHKQKQSYKQ